MKRWIGAIMLAGAFFGLLFATGCTSLTKYKSWTEEKNADGSVKTIRSESVSQTVPSGKLTLEKIKID